MQIAEHVLTLKQATSAAEPFFHGKSKFRNNTTNHN